MSLSEDQTYRLTTANPSDIPSTAAPIQPGLASSSATHFTPDEPEKPRPHSCCRCPKAFARLEHLKRHERSHTKEKPFSCTHCPRCFARKDLLQRHQQKLHSQFVQPPKQRAARRKSSNTSATNTPGLSKSRRHSTANILSTAAPKPRSMTANTIDSADLAALRAAAGAPVGHGHQVGLGSLSDTNPGYEAPYSSYHLPRLDTTLDSQFNEGLRTAPALGAAATDFGINSRFETPSPPTMDPSQLHYDQPLPLLDQGQGSLLYFPESYQSGPLAGLDDTDWTHPDMSLALTTAPLTSDHAVLPSKPPTPSDGSRVGISEAVLASSIKTAASIMYSPVGSDHLRPDTASIDMDYTPPEYRDLWEAVSSVGNSPPLDCALYTPPPSALTPPTGVPGSWGCFDSQLTPTAAAQPFSASAAQGAPAVSAYSDRTGHSSMHSSLRNDSFASISAESMADATMQSQIGTAVLADRSQAMGLKT